MTVLALPNPDWLAQTLIVSGPAAEVAGFCTAASGAGAIPWQYDLDRMQEDWFLRMLAPAPAEREISVAGARILAATYRDLVDSHHAQVVARIGHSTACPLDLHALIPVPDAILRLGPDDPASRAWLWQHWGTTWPLQHVVRISAGHDRRLRRSARVTYRFFSADWTPWMALRTLRARWPRLIFAIRPDYGWDDHPTERAGTAAGKPAVVRKKRRRRPTARHPAVPGRTRRRSAPP
jgi:hypothetical protein